MNEKGKMSKSNYKMSVRNYDKKYSCDQPILLQSSNNGNNNAKLRQHEPLPQQGIGKKSKSTPRLELTRASMGKIQNYKNIKDIIVHLDQDNIERYNLEPASSFENTSSRGLIESHQTHQNANDTSASNLMENNTNRGSDSLSENGGDGEETDSESVLKNPATSSAANRKKFSAPANLLATTSLSNRKSHVYIDANHKTPTGECDQRKGKCCQCLNEKAFHSKSFVSCYILQQYFVYLMLCAIIICGSFGFYYVIVSTNLRLEAMEKKLNEKIDKRMPLNFVSYKDYFANNKNSEPTPSSTGNF